MLGTRGLLAGLLWKVNRRGIGTDEDLAILAPFGQDEIITWPTDLVAEGVNLRLGHKAELCFSVADLLE